MKASTLDGKGDVSHLGPFEAMPPAVPTSSGYAALNLSPGPRTVLFAVPAFVLIGIGDIWSTLAGLSLVAFPVTFYVANLASALPALFPTSSRYSSMGIAYNFSVALFGGGQRHSWSRA